VAWDQRPRDPQQQDGFDAIGAMVRRRRAWLGWSQRYLELRSGLDQTVISRIENGKQYGIRWSRFATLVGAMGGLDIPDATQTPRPGPRDRAPGRRLDVIDLTPNLADHLDDPADEAWPVF
jgi:transcriptional regulator with XRE-family HTH domain